VLTGAMKEGRGGHVSCPPDFWLVPLLASPVFCLISRSSSFDWHLQQISFRQKILNDLKTFWWRFWLYSQAYVGFDRFDHSKSIFITTENHHAEETFMLVPLHFSLAPQWPLQFFHSRIADGWFHYERGQEGLVRKTAPQTFLAPPKLLEVHRRSAAYIIKSCFHPQQQTCFYAGFL